MSRIPEETIQAIRDRVDVVDLIGRYVTLKKAGRSFKGLCPFHQEKTPSFTVNPESATSFYSLPPRRSGSKCWPRWRLFLK